jgi:hypothetical protein
MFQSGSRFSKSDRRMNRHELIQAISYYTEAQVKENKTGQSNPFFDALPKPIEKDKLEEALKLFEVGNQGSTTTPP